MIPDFHSDTPPHSPSPHVDALLQDAWSRHPVLREYPTLSAALAALAPASATPYWQRDAITCAFIREAQLGASGLWIKALFAAYTPMLARLRARLRPRSEGREFDQLVCAAFLEVVHAYPAEHHRDRTALRLRQQTKEIVFGTLERERATHTRLAKLAQSLPPSVNSPFCASRGGDEDDPEALARTLRHYAGDLAPQDVDMLIRTTVGGQSLIGYLTQRHAELGPEELKRLYEAVRRRRSRWLLKIRDRLRDAVRDDDDTERCAL